jgi:hypothetical protein
MHSNSVADRHAELDEMWLAAVARDGERRAGKARPFGRAAGLVSAPRAGAVKASTVGMGPHGAQATPQGLTAPSTELCARRAREAGRRD